MEFSTDARTRPSPAITELHDEFMEFVGGFELVRQLGTGPRAEVFLGRSGDSPISRSTAGVALKVYRASTSVAEIESEIEALSRTDSAHLLRLIDITTASDRKPALILSPVGVRRLSDLVVGNLGLSLGEVVTATAPIVGAVAELHRVGITHGAVKLSNIVFDRRGTPVLVGFGKATVIGARPADGTVHSLPPAIQSESPGIAVDLADLAVVIRCVCAASPEDTTSLCDWLDATPQPREPKLWLTQLEAALYDLAPGEPVSFDGQSTARPPGALNRPATRALTREGAERGEAEPGGPEQGERRSALIESRDARRTSFGEMIGLPTPVLELIRTPIPAIAKRCVDGARAVRRPFWLAGGVIAAVLVAALAFVPDDRQSPADALQPQESVSSSPSPAVSAEAVPSDAPTANSSGDPSTRKRDGASQQVATIRGDDPSAALGALIAARAQCLDTRSLECLEQVDQPGSAAWDADTTFVERYESGQTADPLLRSAANVNVTDRLGDSAIATASDAATGIPVTVLLIRGGDGWRIRDIIAP